MGFGIWLSNTTENFSAKFQIPPLGRRMFVLEHTKYAPIKQNTIEYKRILPLLSLKCYWPKYFKSDSLSKNNLKLYFHSKSSFY